MIADFYRWIRNSTRPLRRRLSPKKYFRFSFERGLRKYAHIKRARSSAIFIGITGSSGKSTTTSLLSHVLAGAGPVHTQLYESTIHKLPRTLRDLPRETRYVVAEVGVSGVGQMAPMAALLRPHIAVVTKIGLEHYSAFRSAAAIALEKGALSEALPNDGMAFVNADDPLALAMAGRSKARSVTFGRLEGADYRVVGAYARYPEPLCVSIRCKRGDFKVSTQFTGEAFWLATVIAFAVGVELGMPPEAAIKRISEFRPIWDRCGLLPIKDGPIFLVDTVKAPEQDIAAAFEILEKARAFHKRIVLGIISDYRGDSRRPYKRAYKIARRFVDQIIFVGGTDHRVSASDTDRMDGKIVGMTTPKETSEFLKKTARPGELVMLKGSRNLHLERIALDWIEPVRCWEAKCGKTIGCLECGLVGIPFEEHAGIRRAQRRRTFWKRVFRPWVPQKTPPSERER